MSQTFNTTLMARMRLYSDRRMINTHSKVHLAPESVMTNKSIKSLWRKQVTSCSMHSIVSTFRGADIKVEVANFCTAMDTLID